ncbi:MAG: ferritin [Candidatus Omnitrophica bacterium]|nr:ferritin [Candidatus Omnitrophota bacterium]
MGTKGRDIVGVDLKELVKLLNKALADEWLAYYQYWAGSKVAVGRMRGIVAGELEEHAKEEFEHAEKLAERIIQLGGTPLINPKQWEKEANCGYDEPASPNTKKLLEQNIKGEQCAIEVYRKILKKVEGKDVLTAHLVLEILEDEVKHEEDLEAILQDMKTKVE